MSAVVPAAAPARPAGDPSPLDPAADVGSADVGSADAGSGGSGSGGVAGPVGGVVSADPGGALPPVPARVRRRVLAAGLAISATALAAQVTAYGLASAAADRGAPALYPPSYLAVAVVLLSITCCLGLLVVTRVPRNPIGWIFLGLGLVLAVPDLASGYASLALLAGVDGLPLATWLVGPAGLSWIAVYASFTAISFIFPDGRPVSPRWRAAAGVSAAIFAVTYAAFLAGTDEYLPPFDVVEDNPWRFAPLLTPAGGVVQTVLWFAMLATLFVGAASVVARFRRSAGVARQQLKWFAYAAATVPLVLVLCGLIALFDLPEAVLAAGFVVLLVSVPAATTVAILRYRLYAIDRLINQTIVYAVLTAVLGGAYAGLVVLGGTVTGRGSPLAVAAATLAAAVAARPLRAGVQQVVDRRFSRRRYEALRVVAAYTAAPRADQDVRDVLARALGDPGLAVVYRAADGSGWLDADGRPAPEPAAGPERAVTVVGPDAEPTAALVHHRALGEQRYLLDSVTAAARLPLDNARLRAEVGRQLAEVRDSRARIVAAGYAERRRVERDLHDGAQQRLVALGLHLRVAQERLADRGPDVTAVLGSAVEELQASVRELRELARGLLPPGLADDGLSAALRALARRAPMPVELDLGPDGDPGRLPPAVEAAAYFVVAEGLTNAAKHARASRVGVAVRRTAGAVEVRVRDDGVGGAVPDPGGGLAGLAERVDTHGGRLQVDSPPGRGTTLVAELPCAS